MITSKDLKIGQEITVVTSYRCGRYGDEIDCATVVGVIIDKLDCYNQILVEVDKEKSHNAPGKNTWIKLHSSGTKIIEIK